MIGLLVAALPALAKDVDLSKLPPAAAKTGVTYASDIKPIFEKSCVKCHSGEKAKAKLHLDTLEGALKGNKDGKVIEPGNSTKSPLLISVAWLGDEEEWMPPKNNKANIARLSAEQVGLIRAWIDQGAK
jgi:hypothetical protein